VNLYRYRILMYLRRCNFERVEPK